MKIVLTGRELSAIKSIMEHTESGSVNELAKGLKDNKIISYSVQPLKKEIEIEVNSDYVSDFLDVYDRFVGIIVDQTKALFKTALMLSEETDKIVEKYVGGDDNA